MSAFLHSKFKFLNVISEEGIIKANIYEKEGFPYAGVKYTQDEQQIYGLIKAANDHLRSNSSNKRLKENIKQLTIAFDAVRTVKIDNNIKLDVNI